MKRVLNPIALALVALVALLATASVPAAAQRDEGWTTLFDGTALTNWTSIGNANWTLGGGIVQASKGNGYLVSKASYRDFQLQVDVWVSDAANSGIFFRCIDPKNISAVSCYEVNIDDNRPATARTGAIVNVARTNIVVKVTDQWATFDVRAEGRKFTVSINGLVVSNGEDGAHAAAGAIALERSDGTVRFRRVRIRPL